MKRRCLLVLCAGTMAGAGCSIDIGSSEGPAHQGSTSTATSSTAPTSENITAYQALTADERDYFQQLLRTGEVVVATDEDSFPLGSAKYVRYDGTVYAVTRERAHIVERTLEYETVEKSNVDESKLVRYEDLPADAREVFDQLLATGRITVRRGETFPPRLTGYVKHRDTYYKVWNIHGDVLAKRLSISEVETDGSRSTP